MSDESHPIENALAALKPDAPLSELSLEGLTARERALFEQGRALKQGYQLLNNRVLRSARLAEASLGSAALIHELRQCLSPIVGLSELLRETPDSQRAPEWAGEIFDQARRLADLLDRHSALMRTTGEDEATAVDLREVAEEARTYFSRLPPGVRLDVAVPRSLPPVHGRRRPLLHALINLIANARDAQRGFPGAIGIRARIRERDVELLVTDQGAGVLPEHRARLFEPLFTTKEHDGTGLGLYLSQELLRPEGTLHLLDEDDKPREVSTAFCICLPRADVQAAASRLSSASEEASREDGGATPTGWAAVRTRVREQLGACVDATANRPVLLVEDEASVRRMTRSVLESVRRLKIHEAADGAFALKLLEKVPVDLLVCDKNLPDVDGLTVIRSARAAHPHIDAIVVTGYPSPDSAAESIRMGATDYLLKPVRDIQTLRDTVSGALMRQRLHRLIDTEGAIIRDSLEALRTAAPDAERGWLEEVGVALDATPERRPHVAVLDGVALDALEAAELGGVTPLRDPQRLGDLMVEVDLVLFPAACAPEVIERLLLAGRRRGQAPHLVPVGTFTQTETAIAALRGRSSTILDANADAETIRSCLMAAAGRHAVERRAEALGTLLSRLELEV